MSYVLTEFKRAFKNPAEFRGLPSIGGRHLCAVAIILSLSLLLLPHISSASEQESDSAVVELKAQLQELDSQIAECRVEQTETSRELVDLGRRMQSMREDQQDEELQQLRAELEAAERKYRDLQTKYRRKLNERPEVREAAERQKELVGRMRDVKQRRHQLAGQRALIEKKIADEADAGTPDSSAGE
jgi:chromosome segregation ATPase